MAESYPEKILPKSNYILEMDIPQLLKVYPNLYVARRIDGDKHQLVLQVDGDNILSDAALRATMDTGYDLQTQVWYSKFLRALSTVKKVNLLVITHSPLVIMDNDEVFSFFSRQLVPSEIFLFETCGLDKYKFFGKPEKSTEEKMNETKKKNNGINNDKG